MIIGIPLVVKILIVDNDRSVRSMVAALLERDGFETVAVGHGRSAVEAIDRAGSADYAAIVVQVNVTPSPIDAAEPTGVALLRHMQRTQPDLVARTVVVTTMSRVEVTVCATIVQPFDIDELLASVRRCLHRTEQVGATGGNR